MPQQSGQQVMGNAYNDSPGLRDGVCASVGPAVEDLLTFVAATVLPFDAVAGQEPSEVVAKIVTGEAVAGTYLSLFRLDPPSFTATLPSRTLKSLVPIFSNPTGWHHITIHTASKLKVAASKSHKAEAKLV